MTKSYKPGGEKLPLAALENRLEREAPEAIAELRTSVSFANVWEQDARMKPTPIPKKRSRSAVWIKAAAAFVIAAGVAAGTNGYLNQKSAGPNLSGISTTDLTYQQGIGVAWTRGYEQIEQRKLSTPLNLTIEDQGVTLTLLDVFYDGTEARINYVAENKKSDPALNEANASFNYTLTVDGASENDISESSRSKTFLDDHRFAGVIAFDFQQEYHPSETTVRLNLTRLTTKDGSWKADIPLSTKKTEAVTRTLYPNTEFELKGRTYKVEKVVAGPITTWLTVNPVESSDPSLQEEFVFQLYDDKENGFMSKWGPTRQYEPFTTLNPQPKYLTLEVNPVTQMMPENRKQVDAEWTGKTPVVLQGYGEDKMTVTGIDFLKDRTVMRYEINNPKLQMLTPSLTDASGQGYLSATLGYRTSADKWTFQMEFAPMSPDSLREISVMMEDRSKEEAPEATVKIPLDWSKSEVGTH